MEETEALCGIALPEQELLKLAHRCTISAWLGGDLNSCLGRMNEGCALLSVHSIKATSPRRPNMATRHRSLVAVQVEEWALVSDIRSSLGERGCLPCSRSPTTPLCKAATVISNDSADGQGVLPSASCDTSCKIQNGCFQMAGRWCWPHDRSSLGPSAKWLSSPPRGFFSRLPVLPHGMGISGQPGR